MAVEPRKNCKECMEWEEHWYWTHLELTRLRFFKLLSHGFSLQLAIPRKFASSFREKLSETVVLKGPSGETWNVGLKETRDDLFLQNGWKDFVDAHSLERGDKLIFKYVGDSCFDVSMFDRRSGCEKESSYFVYRSDNPRSKNGFSMKRQREKSVGHTHEAPTTRHGANKCSNSPTKKARSFTREQKARTGEESSDRLVEPKMELDPDTCNGIFKGSATSSMRLISNRRPVTEAERTKAMKLAKAHASAPTKPNFIVTMCPTHVYKKFILTIPKEVIRNHVRHKPAQVILRVPPSARTWSVQCLYYKAKSGLRGGGWVDFVRDNNLEEGDVCKFLLDFSKKSRSSATTIVIDVLIFRVVEEITPLVVATAHCVKKER